VAAYDTLRSPMAADGDGGGGDDGEMATLTGANAAAQPNRPTVGRFTLTIVEGPRMGESWESTGDRCAIGSNPLNDLVIEDPTVSRFHCELLMEEEGPRLTDLRSRNGTLVNGLRVRDAYLRGGALIRLGQVTLRFDFSSERNRLRLSDSARFGRLVGTSLPMRAAFALLERAATSDSTVLLEGETGTGKGQAAEALHAMSARAARPFVVIDCASIPSNLLESELFGHERGAFTGADARRTGAFEEADGGTVFLDEVGELPAALQPKLLRTLENRQVRRVGSNSFRPIDVRVIAATNRDLRAEVNAGRFRADLFFRLAVIRVRLPALRERPEDVPELVRSVLSQLEIAEERAVRLLGPAFLGDIMQHTWPGNVRELRNYIERCLLFDEPVPVHDASLDERGEAVAAVAGTSFAEARARALAAFERSYVAQVLERAGGDVAAAAAQSGVSRVYLYKLIKRHRLRGD
jgi:two-component system, NtrC family, response regulator GlrR